MDTYIKRDVRDLSQVGDESAFARFMAACASRTGRLLNMGELYRDADVPPSTGRRWLSILETSGLVFRLEPYFINATKSMIKAPKLYFLDTGLAAYLAGYDSPTILERGTASGAFFETWVMAEIMKKLAGKRPAGSFFFTTAIKIKRKSLS